MKRISCNSLLT